MSNNNVNCSRTNQIVTKVSIKNVALENGSVDSESPWIKYAGIFKDDPDFAEIAAAIRAERESDDETEVDPSVYMR